MKHKARFITSNLIVFALFLSAVLPLQSFASSMTPITPVKTYMDANLKGALNQEVPDLLDKKQQQMSTTYNAYEFTPTEADFATNKWQKYISAVYVYATDVSFIVTTGFVDGRIEQKTSFDSTEVDKILSDAKASNEEIQALAASTPDNSFKAFYESVYKKNLIKLYTGEFYTIKALGAFNLDTKAPQLSNKIIADYNIYKKGNFYLVTWSEYPSFNQHSFVSSSISVINKQLSDIENANINLLVGAKLITKPVPAVVPKEKTTTPSFAVIILYSDKTYTITKFATKAEAEKYTVARAKLIGKANVLIVSTQAEIDKITKGLKLRVQK